MCSPSSRPPRFMPFTISNDSPFFCRGRPMCLPSLPSPPLCPPRWFSGRTRRSAPTFITAFNHPPFGVGANLCVRPLRVHPDSCHLRFQTIPHSSVGADLCVCPLRLRPLAPWQRQSPGMRAKAPEAKALVMPARCSGGIFSKSTWKISRRISSGAMAMI